jgi:putative membrane protein
MVYRRIAAQLFSCALAGTLAVAVLGAAPTTARADDPTPADLSPRDRLFVTFAATDNLAAIRLGNIALQFAATDAVRLLAEQVVADATAAQQDLIEIATAKGYEVPPGIFEIPEAGSPSGTPNIHVDIAFLETQLASNRMAAIQYVREVNEGTDADVRAYAENQLPVLRDNAVRLRVLLRNVRNQAP